MEFTVAKGLLERGEERHGHAKTKKEKSLAVQVWMSRSRFSMCTRLARAARIEAPAGSYAMWHV